MITMNRAFMLLLMLWLHVLADFHLQDILARMKQRSWWLSQEGYGDRYRNDWAIAMWIHAFEWTFVVMLPLMYRLNWQPTRNYILIFVGQMFIHAVVDHMKANMRVLSLVGDQLIHVCQILVIWCMIP